MLAKIKALALYSGYQLKSRNGLYVLLKNEEVVKAGDIFSIAKWITIEGTGPNLPPVMSA